MKKRGVSPVIATILLIGIVVVLSMIVFLWAKGFIKEVVQKKSQPADQACGEINLEAVYINGELQVKNNGNIPVYSFEIRKKYDGGVDIQKSDERLTLGQAKTISIEDTHSYNEIEIIPVILGEQEKGKTAYTCKTSIIAR